MLHGVRGGIEQFQPPEPLSFDGNLAENWHRWKQRFEIYMTASGRDTKSDAIKSATFLHVVGPEFNTLTFDNKGDQRKLSVLVEKFEEYCTGRDMYSTLGTNKPERRLTNT